MSGEGAASYRKTAGSEPFCDAEDFSRWDLRTREEDRETGNDVSG
jgi:hypothetical protein